MLSERTIEILKNNDMKIYDRCEQDGEFTREIEFYSPEGEDGSLLDGTIGWTDNELKRVYL